MAICEIQTATYLPGGGVQKPSSQIAASPPAFKLIPLTQGKCALVDDEDFDWLNEYNWWTYKRRDGRFYAARMEYKNSKQKFIFMHRAILNTPSGMETDHKDHDGLNNRRENLRICNHSQNQHNQRFHKKGTSIFKGVCWNRISSKWQAQIRIERRIYLGCFNSEIEAAIAYNKAAIELFGEFACLNDISGILTLHSILVGGQVLSPYGLPAF